MGILYAILGCLLLQRIFSAQLNEPLPIISLCIKIAASLLFVLVTLGLYRSFIFVSIFALVFYIGIVLMVPLYFKYKYGFVRKRVYLPAGGLIIGGITALSIVGYIFNVLSSFAIFTIVMVMLFLGFLSASITLAISKANQ